MIDLATETRIDPAEYCRLYDVHIATFYRHAFKGVNGFKLEIAKIGGRTFTSREAVQRFSDRLTQAKTCAHVDSAIRIPAARTRANAKAERELSKLGV
jgi:Protein of unknown function (DUF1580)